jgi:hypothetical protein
MIDDFVTAFVKFYGLVSVVYALWSQENSLYRDFRVSELLKIAVD